MKLQKALIALTAPLFLSAGSVFAAPQSKTCFVTYGRGVEDVPCKIDTQVMESKSGNKGVFMVVEYETGRTTYYGVWDDLTAQHTPHGTKEILDGKVTQGSDGDLILIFDDHAFSWLPQN